jgi:hypothetical protein
MSSVADVLKSYGDMITGQMKRILISKRKRATGELINSISYKITGNVLEITYDKYGNFVRNGRRPGAKQPPLLPIMAWIKVKRVPILKDGLPTGKSKSMISKGRKQPSENELKGMAYVIARSIGKKGIQAVDFLTPLKILKSVKFKTDLKNAIIEQIKNNKK